MSSPLEQAGATREPSEYAALTMDRGITGLWTQRSPLRDADVPYLYGKFYSASRFDSIIDGLNREITSKLTWRRRPGNSVYNSNSFPAINSFYPYKCIQNGVEILRVLADGADGNIYDATAGQKATLFTKSPGAAKSRFAGVNTELFFSDGVDLEKWLFPAGWSATATTPATANIASIENDAVGGGNFVLAVTMTAPPPFVSGAQITLAGLTTATQFNGAVRTVLTVTGNKIVCQAVFGGAAYGPAADTGTATGLANLVSPGTLINVGAEPGTIQMALGGIQLPIVAWSSDGANITLYVNPQNIPLQFANLVNVPVAFSGFGSAAFLNGNSYPVAKVLSSTLGIFQIVLAHAVTAFTVDSGVGSTGSGATGGSQPSFSTTRFAVTADGGQQWKCYGPAIQNWGLAAPTSAPTLTPQAGVRYWQPNTSLTGFYTVLDTNGNIQTVGVFFGRTGLSYPKWAPLQPNAPAFTNDGGNSWINLGVAGPWQATAAYVTYQFSTSTRPSVILDSNGNLQWASTAGTSAGAAPAWATTIGTTTNDGTIVWTCLGPGVIIATQSWRWAFSTHGIDGSVSTATPFATIQGGILGPSIITNPNLIAIAGNFQTDTQIDQIFIWRTAQGQSTLVLEDAIPADGLNASFTYSEQGIPDTSTNGGGALTPQAPAPIAQANNPPPRGMTAPLYHLGRIWAIYQNTVVVSGGPNTLVGNGNTAFAPLSFFPIPEQPIRLFATITSAGPGILVWGRANIYIILGQGTPSSPFQQAARYMAGCGILNYDAVTQIGSTYYAFGNTALLGGQLVGKAFSLDPGAGYVEYGFPIGDQFASVATGAGGKIPSGAPTGYLYNPASTFVTWAELGSGDTALYIADGSIGWFRYSPVASPESGFLWSPRAVIVGGTSAVQGIETQPGVTQLLLGPAVGGPILFRDSTVSGDWVPGGGLTGFSVANGGAGYQNGDVISPVQAGGAGSQLIVQATGGIVTGLSSSVIGNGYHVANGVPTTGGHGTGCTINILNVSAGAYVAYPSYDVKGCIQLCLSGEVGEVAHVHVVSMPQGARPKVGLLFGEILPSVAAPFSWYDPTSPEPPNLAASQSVYSDRYSMLSKGVTPKCLFFQLGMDYGSQNFPDETLMFSVYGAKYAERKQQ